MGMLTEQDLDTLKVYHVPLNIFQINSQISPIRQPMMTCWLGELKSNRIFLILKDRAFVESFTEINDNQTVS